MMRTKYKSILIFHKVTFESKFYIMQLETS